jgi:hypothetical protein
VSPGPAAEPPPQAPAERLLASACPPGPSPGTWPGASARDRVTGDLAGAKARRSAATSLERTRVYKVTSGLRPGVPDGRPPAGYAMIAGAKAADRRHHRKPSGAEGRSSRSQGKTPLQVAPPGARARDLGGAGLRDSPRVSRKMGLTISSRVPKPRDRTAVFRAGAGRRKEPSCCSGCPVYRRGEHVGHRMAHGYASVPMAPERLVSQEMRGDEAISTPGPGDCFTARLDAPAAWATFSLCGGPSETNGA